MKVLAIFLGLLALPSACFAQAGAHETPLYLEKPTYIRKATGADVARYYPDAMQRANASGAGVAECRVQPSGELSECSVLHENPKNMGLGAAIIALSKLISIDPKVAPTVAGRYLLIPIVLRVPGEGVGVDNPNFRSGQPAYVVTNKRGGRPASVLPCPTATEPKRQCFLHVMEWEARPDFGVEAGHIEKIGRRTGRLTMSCTVMAEGGLADCSPSEPLSGAEASGLGGLLSEFKASSKATDGTPSAGATVAMVFDFAAITAMIDASALKRPR